MKKCAFLHSMLAFTSLENELAKQSQLLGIERDSRQCDNLWNGFKEVQPISFTDLAFVVWCGEQQESVADVAREYRSRRDSGAFAKDYYPFISLQYKAVPDSRGLYVFREEFSVLIQESLGLLSRRHAADITYQMYARLLNTRTMITRDNFQETVSDLISVNSLEQAGIDKMYNLFLFINKEYGKSFSFTYCATIADRACSA